ncbi:hypothetical protein EYF80_018626 [Liparis tanakae]|uniref:Protein kinase domain-containing protein n=1 Tax=Liparis tanakae TaxID=230148 RepID=A0A4Z2HZ87_9TELE|nr:hypothetical protein EYF80_018626 [Liparis tanakae]
MGKSIFTCAASARISFLSSRPTLWLSGFTSKGLAASSSWFRSSSSFTILSFMSRLARSMCLSYGTAASKASHRPLQLPLQLLLQLPLQLLLQLGASLLGGQRSSLLGRCTLALFADLLRKFALCLLKFLILPLKSARLLLKFLHLQLEDACLPRQLLLLLAPGRSELSVLPELEEVFLSAFLSVGRLPQLLSARGSRLLLQRQDMFPFEFLAAGVTPVGFKHGRRPIPSEPGSRGDLLKSGSSRYPVEPVVGQGTFGTVVKCTNVADNKTVAVKMMRNRGSSARAEGGDMHINEFVKLVQQCFGQLFHQLDWKKGPQYDTKTTSV